eukprot:2786611-Amphidinium_carterae.1
MSFLCCNSSYIITVSLSSVTSHIPSQRYGAHSDYAALCHAIAHCTRQVRLFRAAHAMEDHKCCIVQLVHMAIPVLPAIFHSCHCSQVQSLGHGYNYVPPRMAIKGHTTGLRTLIVRKVQKSRNMSLVGYG